MRIHSLPVTLTAIALIVTGCTLDDTPALTPAPINTGAIVDSAPYICRLVPDQAFQLVSGVDKTLSEETSGNDGTGDCWTPNTTSKPLTVAWMQENAGSTREHLDYVMDDRRAAYSRHGAVTLPTDLGEGLAVHFPEGPFSDQPYRVVSRFACGGKQRIITLYLAQVAKGRDGIRDMIDLMRIAQKRYGHLYKCALGE
ncbi:hypothetical protein ABT352_22010 [Streptosporangium sp. NPDC000563]|uniref:hypothetical protein n=1 Tax=Streptosporangium sp. NPDC000563 TaxID=3154366 RepID=UPI003319BAC2